MVGVIELSFYFLFICFKTPELECVQILLNNGQQHEHQRYEAQN
jgi:hypothetical protein